MGPERSLQCKYQRGEESKAWCSSRSSLPLVTHIPDGARGAPALHPCGLSGQAGKKVSAGQLSLRLGGPPYGCAAAAPTHRGPGGDGTCLPDLLFGMRHLKGAPSPSLLDICPEINWANPLLGRMGWSVCVPGRGRRPSGNEEASIQDGAGARWSL